MPQNYDRHFRGWVSVRQALASSLNVPAVRTIGMVGVNRFADQLQRLGIKLPRTGDHYGYSLALGSAETGLLQLTNAYRTLANGGRYGETRLQPASNTAPSPGRQALDAHASFIIGHILSDNNARLATFGDNSVLHTRFWTAVKTGTSKDMRDNWAIGYSTRYTVGVWVGNAQGQAMWDVSGTTGAAPVWASIMQYLHRDAPSPAPQPPVGLVQTRVDFGSPESGSTTEPSRMEWFIRGTEQSSFARPPRTSSRAAARILHPVNGTLLAIDPDIPPKRQRLNLRASISNGRWAIDGKPVGQGQSLPWMPWPGRHRITLQTASGQVLDAVEIEVRGAAVRASATVPGKRLQRQGNDR